MSFVRITCLCVAVASVACLNDPDLGGQSQELEFPVEPKPGEADAGTGGEGDGGEIANPVPVGEPECPEYPDDVDPIDPGIASGSQCRGACGPNCPDTCRSLPPRETCLEWQDEEGNWHSKICRYEGLIECGSHQGCREHDACYDGCATARFPATCRRGCDLACTRRYGVSNCYDWWGGDPPYDSWLSFGPGTFTEEGPYDTTCY